MPEGIIKTGLFSRKKRNPAASILYNSTGCPTGQTNSPGTGGSALKPVLVTILVKWGIL
ncbi:hypothetical protein SAMN04490178_11614 [Propionispora vibrioides]|uniref:Uncharacterized protein n=1 Tax=Propionispora vibrioides TaxID=112903 RepID=A0A1H8WIY6_9FIRM|nr:hypothetical protein SAMN04490178_11614 [Propionispora vibrioides]